MPDLTEKLNSIVEQIQQFEQLKQFEAFSKSKGFAVEPKVTAAAGGGIVLFCLVTGLWASFVANLIGFIYPSYASFKVVEGKSAASGLDQAGANAQWLTYWVCFSFVNMMETFARPFCLWIPFFYSLKIVLLCYLSLPAFNGALSLNKSVLRLLAAAQQEPAKEGAKKSE